MTTNYFKILNLAENFDLDLSVLDKNYFAAQIQFHPDKAENDQQKKHFLDLAVQLNEAYENLKDELRRAQALLSIEGIDFDDENIRKNLDPEFLQSIWDEFAAIENTSDSSELSHRLAIQYLRKKSLVENLTNTFSAKDINKSTEMTMCLKYVDNIIDAIKRKLQHAINK